MSISIKPDENANFLAKPKATAQPNHPPLLTCLSKMVRTAKVKPQKHPAQRPKRSNRSTAQPGLYNLPANTQKRPAGYRAILLLAADGCDRQAGVGDYTQ